MSSAATSATRTARSRKTSSCATSSSRSTQKIRAGNPPEFFHTSANVRSFSYYCRDLVRKHSWSFGGAKDVYEIISTELTAMVKAGLYSYKDFNIVDERRVYRQLAPVYANPHLVLIGEKISFFGLCVKYANRYGLTIQMTRGIPSFVTSDTGGLYGTGGKDYGLSADHVLGLLDGAVERYVPPCSNAPPRKSCASGPLTP